MARLNGFYLVLLLKMALPGLVVLAGPIVGRLRPAAVAAPAPAVSAQPGTIPARTFLRTALGLLWLLDALLQAQPRMPGGFPTLVLAPVAHGTPGWWAAFVRWEIAIWQAHPVYLAAATVLIQAGIGIAILCGGDGRLGRWGLWASLAWGLMVWVGGEALGGLLAPGASLLAGSPGAVLAYVGAAGLLLAPVELWRTGRARRLIEVGLGTTFLFGAVLQSIPGEGFWRGAELKGLFAAMAAPPQPSALAAPIHALAGQVAADPFLWNTAIIATMVALGVAHLLGGRGRFLTIATMAWLAFAWWFGQGFGTPATGVATDPNLTPVLAVLLLVAEFPTGWAVAGQRRLPFAARRGWARRLALAGAVALLVGLVGSVPYAAQAALGSSPAAPVSASVN